MERVRRELAARRVRVPYLGEPPRQIAGLPDNLALSPGRLEIRFHVTEEPTALPV